MFARSYTWMMGYFEGAALSRACGISVETYTETALALLGRVHVNIERSAAQISQNSYPVATEASISVHRAALSKTRQLAGIHNIAMPALEVAEQYFDREIAAGWADHELAACFTATFDSKR